MASRSETRPASSLRRTSWPLAKTSKDRLKSLAGISGRNLRPEPQAGTSGRNLRPEPQDVARCDDRTQLAMGDRRLVLALTGLRLNLGPASQVDAPLWRGFMASVVA